MTILKGSGEIQSWYYIKFKKSLTQHKELDEMRNVDRRSNNDVLTLVTFLQDKGLIYN